MTAVLDRNTSFGNRGSHYNKGSEFAYYVNELKPEVWRQPVNPVTMIVQQAARSLVSGQLINLNSLGAADLKWVGGTTKQVQPQLNVKLVKLTGFTAFEQIQPEALALLAWSTVPTNNMLSEDGLSTTGNYYAVQIPISASDMHYAKVRIFNDGAPRIEWVSYLVGTQPSVVLPLGPAELTAPRDVYVNELDTEIYVSGGVGAAGYVAKFPRILGGPFPKYFDSPTYLNNPYGSSPLVNPQQLFVDGSLVFVVAEGGLYALQSLREVQVVSGIASPVGLLLDVQRSSTMAYISDINGHVYAVDISGFSFDPSETPPPIAAPPPKESLALGGPSGFLTWTDDTRTSFYATVRGATGKVRRVDLVAMSVSDELTTADPLLLDPWSVEVFAESSLSIVCDGAIYDVERGIPISTEIALGLGLVPFSMINNSDENPETPAPYDGRADTSIEPGYHFSAYPNLAFGGNINLLLNHGAAYSSNLRYYKLSVQGEDGESIPITNPFTDLIWKSSVDKPRFEAKTTSVSNGSYFEIRKPSELWYTPFLGGVLQTGRWNNGHNRLKIELFQSMTSTVGSVSYTRLVYVDNNRSSVSLSHMRRGSTSQPPAAGDYAVPEGCGLIAYSDKDERIAFDLTAVHPAGVGKYVLTFYRGATALFSVTGNLTATSEMITVSERSPGVPLRIGHLTGNCDIANISVGLSAPSPGVINGHGWVSLGSSTSRAFTFAKSPLTHNPWPPAAPFAPLMGPDAEKRGAIVVGPPLKKK